MSHIPSFLIIKVSGHFKEYIGTFTNGFICFTRPLLSFLLETYSLLMDVVTNTLVIIMCILFTVDSIKLDDSALSGTKSKSCCN